LNQLLPQKGRCATSGKSLPNYSGWPKGWNDALLRKYILWAVYPISFVIKLVDAGMHYTTFGKTFFGRTNAGRVFCLLARLCGKHLFIGSRMNKGKKQNNGLSSVLPAEDL